MLSHLISQAPPQTSLPALINPPFLGQDPSRSFSRSFDGDSLADMAGRERAASLKGVHLPTYSRAFRFLDGENVYSGVSGSGPDYFLVPSYLRGSRYLDRLAELHQARLAAQRDATMTHTPNGGSSLSTSSSSANLHKMAMSYRGMTYDIIEKEPAADNSGLSPLPTRWNEHDRFGGLELHSDGLDVQFVGPGRSQENIEAAAVRADYPMAPQCGIYYYEVVILSKGKEG